MADEFGCSEVVLLRAMMASSVNEGQELEESEPSLAVAMALNAVKNLRDDRIARSIVSRIIRQYHTA